MNTIGPLGNRPEEISVATPISPALDRVNRMLFQPFDLTKWFVIGFCAWLAFLGEGGGGGGGGVQNGFGNSQHTNQLRHGFEEARHFVVSNLHWLIPVFVVGVVLVIAVGMLIVWLRSRGKFMFLHCVARNVAEVAVPWSRYARQANSYFWFQIVLSLIGMALILPVLGGVAYFIIQMIANQSWTAGGIGGIVALVLLLVLLGLAVAVVQKLTSDFVVPIMYLRQKRCLEAWGELRGLLGANTGRFFLYLLFQLVLNMAIGLLVVVVYLVTCCVCCLGLLPYLSTVIMLPVLVFQRSYSLYYLAQYGADYDVFRGAEPAIPPVTPAV